MFDILVAEDDIKLRRIICTVLDRNGYNSVAVEDGRDALDMLERKHIDLIISDICMPFTDGCELTASLRAAGYTTPVLMVTAKDSYGDKQRGFLAGADDYMVKPINLNELLLRVKALLRRARIADERKLSFGNTLLDYDSYTIHFGEKTTELPQKEFLLLYKLLSYPGRIYTRQQLMDEIWGPDSETDERTVDVHINRLRERIGEWKDFDIITVRGLGYKAVIKI